MEKATGRSFSCQLLDAPSSKNQTSLRPLAVHPKTANPAPPSVTNRPISSTSSSLTNATAAVPKTKAPGAASWPLHLSPQRRDARCLPYEAPRFPAVRVNLRRIQFAFHLSEFQQLPAFCKSAPLLRPTASSRRPVTGHRRSCRPGRSPRGKG